MSNVPASLKRSVAAFLFPYREFFERTNWNARWMHTIKQHRFPLFRGRTALYDYLNSDILRGSPIEYLEFGVAGGDSMRSWCQINSLSESRFYGFDCFTGLPEDWTAAYPKGSFDRGGIPPDIPDERVTFHVGLFQETLPGFLSTYRATHQILIHSDSDLYSSTLYTLAMLDRHLVDGTVVIFDEFCEFLHEYKALVEYCTAFRKKFEIIAATELCTQAAVRLMHNGD